MKNPRPLGLLLTVLLATSLQAASGQPAPALPDPLTLEAAVAYALEWSPGLQRQREQIREQEGVVLEARAGFLPTVAVSGSAGKIQATRLESPGVDDTSWSVGVTATQTLYAGGGNAARVKTQREQLEVVRLAYQAQVNQVVAQVKTQFYQVLLDKELIRVNEEAVTVLEASVSNAKNRRDAGTASDFEVLRAEVSVSNARTPLIRARNALELAVNQLETTLGAKAEGAQSARPPVIEGSLEVPVREETLESALAIAAVHRPELLSIEPLLRAAKAGVDVAASGHLPTLSVYAGYSSSSPQLLSTQKDQLSGWNAGVTGSWAVFDGRATTGRVRQAKSRVAQAEATAAETELTVKLEIRQALLVLAESRQLLDSSRKAVEQARESLRLTQARFAEGTATHLDVLQAQSSLTEARSNVAQALHDLASAQAALDRAVGR